MTRITWGYEVSHIVSLECGAGALRRSGFDGQPKPGRLANQHAIAR